MCLACHSYVLIGQSCISALEKASTPRAIAWGARRGLAAAISKQAAAIWAPRWEAAVQHGLPPLRPYYPIKTAGPLEPASSMCSRPPPNPAQFFFTTA